jgi:hypothetical protein
MYDPAPLTSPPDVCAATMCDELLAIFASGAAPRRAIRQGSHTAPARPTPGLRADDIASISSACHAHNVQMVAYGSGTSLEGWLRAVLESVCIDATGMQRIAEFHGPAAQQADAAPLAASEHGMVNFEWSVRTQDRSRLWQARHHAGFAAIALRPDNRSQAAARRNPANNFYALILIDPADRAELDRAKALAQRLGERAIALGGGGLPPTRPGLHDALF